MTHGPTDDDPQPQPSWLPPSYSQPPYSQPPDGQPASPPPPSRRSRLPWIIGTIVAAGLLVLGGASFAVWYSWSGRTAPTTQTPPAAASSWLAATNAYCRSTTDPQIKEASPLSATDLAAYLTRIAAINRDLNTVLRKDPPSSLRVQVERVASDWDRMTTLFDQAATALGRNDRAAAARLVAQGDAANQLGNELATRIGLQDCADAGAIGATASASAPGITV